ncbi:MAG: hypothetical protein WCH10_00070 [bacterium]
MLGKILKSKYSKVSIKVDNIELVVNEGNKLLKSTINTITGFNDDQRRSAIEQVEVMVEALGMSKEVKAWLVDLLCGFKHEFDSLRKYKDILDAVNGLKFIQRMQNVETVDFDEDSKKYIYKVKNGGVKTDIERIMSVEMLIKRDIKDREKFLQEDDKKDAQKDVENKEVVQNKDKEKCVDSVKPLAISDTKIKELMSTIKNDIDNMEKMRGDIKQLEKDVASLIESVVSVDIQKKIDAFIEAVKNVQGDYYKHSMVGMCANIVMSILEPISSTLQERLAVALIDPLVNKLFANLLPPDSLTDLRDSISDRIRYGNTGVIIYPESQVSSLAENYFLKNEASGPIINSLENNQGETDIKKFKKLVEESVEKSISELTYQLCVQRVGEKTDYTFIEPKGYEYLNDHGVVFDIRILISALGNFEAPLISGKPKALSVTGLQFGLEYLEQIKSAVEYFGFMKNELFKLLGDEQSDTIKEYIKELEKLENLGQTLSNGIKGYHYKVSKNYVIEAAKEFKLELENVMIKEHELCNFINHHVSTLRWNKQGEESASKHAKYFVDSKYEGGTFREYAEMEVVDNSKWKKYETAAAFLYGKNIDEKLKSLLLRDDYSKEGGVLGKILKSKYSHEKVSIKVGSIGGVKDEGARLLKSMGETIAGFDSNQRKSAVEQVDIMAEALGISKEVKSWLVAFLEQDQVRLDSLGDLKNDKDILDAVNGLKFIRRMQNVEAVDFGDDSEKYIYKVGDKNEEALKIDIERIVSVEMLIKRDIQEREKNLQEHKQEQRTVNCGKLVKNWKKDNKKEVEEEVEKDYNHEEKRPGF